MGVPLLELEHVSKTFPGVKALSDVHFDIYPGEVHALVGENGAGKSTFIKVISGAHQPDAGSLIRINGEEVTIKNVTDSMAKGIAVIYQDISLFGNLTVAENIVINQLLGEKKKRMNWPMIKRRAREALKTLHSDINPMDLLENLSVAKQQVVAIAGAIAQDAKLVIMDEPTSTLSKSEIESLYAIIDHLKSKGVAVIFISHKMDELFRVSDRFTVLRDGQYIATMKKEDTTPKQLISLMVGREIDIINYAKEDISDIPVLEVLHLTKKGNFKDVSFTLHKGEILGITGLVGAGRTELIEAIYGIHTPDSGVIKKDGREVRIRNTEDARNNQIAYIPEDRKREGLVLSKTLAENITLPILKACQTRFGLVDQNKAEARVQNLMNELDVRPNNPQLLGAQLSGGNQQKVVLAKWIGTNADIFFLDEPTNGVDIGAKSEIYRILRRLAEEGHSLIVVTSELAEALSVCDRILVMRQGRISGEFKNKDVTQEMLMGCAIVR